MPDTKPLSAMVTWLRTAMRITYAALTGVLRWLRTRLKTGVPLAVLALILSAATFYRQFFYRSEELKYVLNSVSEEQLYEGRQLLMSLSFALANTGTEPVIISGMCLVTANAQGGTDYWLWWADRQGTIAHPILVEPESLTQHDVLFYLPLYFRAFPHDRRPSDKDWPIMTRLELIDSEGNKLARTISGTLVAGEHQLSFGYRSNFLSRDVLPIPANDESAGIINCASASARRTEPLPRRLTDQELHDWLVRRDRLREQLFPSLQEIVAWGRVGFTRGCDREKPV